MTSSSQKHTDHPPRADAIPPEILPIISTLPSPSPDPVRLERRRLSHNEALFIIAELGTGHNGDIGKAKEMVHAAKEAGADCVKVQIVFADEIIHRRTGSVPLPGGPTPLYEVFRRIERDTTFYERIVGEARRCGVCPLATPFGARSQAMVAELELPAVKIASPELNHFELIDTVNGYGHPVFLSSGVSTLADIDRALSRLRVPTVLFHCITAYPAPPEQYNLLLIHTLKAIFGVWTGVSDHSIDPVLVPVLSSALGAVAIEKHLTLSTAGGGLDDPIALTPTAFTRMCSRLRTASAMPADEVISELTAEFGETAVLAAMGDGVKRLATAERENYGRTNRSIHALVDIEIDEILSRENTVVLRTEKRLKPGLTPEYYADILGSRTRRRIPAGEGVTWKDLLTK